jgi:flagellar hook assembly protein FlgD
VLAPIRAPFRFDLVGAHWRGQHAVVDLRVRSAAGAWSAWQPVSPSDPDPQEQRDLGVVDGEPAWAPGSTAVQLRVTGQAQDLRASFVAAGPNPPALRRREYARNSTDQPTIITRAQWGADESIRRADPQIAPTISVVFVHHTDTPNGYTEAQSAAIVRSIYVYHVKSNGWNDIGYNFLVDAYGQVFEGRYGGITRNVVGAHVLGFNTGSVGIALIGNGQTKAMTEPEQAALTQLISWRLDLAHVDPLGHGTLVSGGNPKFVAGKSVSFRVVSGHRDGYPTECPGDLIYAALPGVAQDAAALGLPKIYAPKVTPSTLPVASGGYVGPITFGGTAAGASGWTVKVLDRLGGVIAQLSGTGTTIAWTWDGRSTAGLPVPAASVAGWEMDAISAGGTQALPASGSFGGKTPAAPVTSSTGLSAAPQSISPNGDGIADGAVLSYSLTAASVVGITITDALGNVVATPQPTVSMPAGPHSVLWNGFGSDGVTPVPDGAYRAILQTVNASGQSATATASITVVRAFGALEVPKSTLSPNGDGRNDTLRIAWRQDEHADVTVEVLRRGQVVATPFVGTLDPGPASVTWDGSANAPLTTGSYLLVVRAHTDAGDEALARSIKIDLSPPVVTHAVVKTWYGGGRLSLRLSEPSYVRITAGRRTVVPFGPRPAGLNSFRWTGQPSRARVVRVYAWDLAGNRMLPRTYRLLGSL